MKNSLIIYILFISSLKVNALGELRANGAKQVGMGFNSVSMINVHSVYNNQAASAFLEKKSIGLYYSPTLIGQNVGNIAAVIGIPMQKAGTIGVSFNYFGYSAYNEKKLGLSYAIKLAKFMSVGMQMDWLHTQIQGYGSKSFATFEFGVLAKPIEELSIGLHVYNPLKQDVNHMITERLPTYLRLGATYEAVEKFFVTLEVEQEFGRKTRVRAGVDYTYKKIVSFRFGLGTDPTIATLGIGVNLKNGLGIDFATSYNANLGFLPHVGLSYEFSNKKLKKENAKKPTSVIKSPMPVNSGNP